MSPALARKMLDPVYAWEALEPEEDQKLQELIDQGIEAIEIASVLKRHDRTAIYSRIQRLQTKKSQPSR